MAGQRRDEGAGRSPDHVLLDELRGMLDRVDPAPAWLLELARLMPLTTPFDWQDLFNGMLERILGGLTQPPA